MNCNDKISFSIYRIIFIVFANPDKFSTCITKDKKLKIKIEV